MGLRGPNAKGGKAAKAKRVSHLKHKPTWRRKGLSRAQQVVRFLESLPVTKGHLAGKPMRLLPSQREFIEAVYGNIDAQGRRVVRMAVLSEPRGNGKSGLLAALSICHLLGPMALDRGAVFSAAIDRNQASILFDEMRAIIQAVPEMEIRTNIMKHWKKIEVLSGAGAGSVYEALSSDARRGHGLAPSFFVFDELGQMKDRELLDALMTAMGKQPQSWALLFRRRRRPMIIRFRN